MSGIMSGDFMWGLTNWRWKTKTTELKRIIHDFFFILEGITYTKLQNEMRKEDNKINKFQRKLIKNIANKITGPEAMLMYMCCHA